MRPSNDLINLSSFLWW